jgi:ElaB/YqjD/DUF883 family membrane-anchored ribosome-binding protein
MDTIRNDESVRGNWKDEVMSRIGSVRSEVSDKLATVKPKVEQAISTVKPKARQMWERVSTKANQLGHNPAVLGGIAAGAGLGIGLLGRWMRHRAHAPTFVIIESC